MFKGKHIDRYSVCQSVDILINKSKIVNIDLPKICCDDNATPCLIKNLSGENQKKIFFIAMNL